VLPRTALEQATHRIVLRRRLPPPFGAARVYASSEGGLRYLRPGMDRVDPALLRLAAEMVKPGDVVWDIGANLGLFTFAAAVLAGPAGHVLAVEPDAVLVGLLRRSAAVNRGHAPTDIFPAAVASDLGIGRFHIARRNRSTNHLDGFGTRQAGGIRATEIVPTVTLDWLAQHFPAPDVIKIDVEEAEVLVLASGNRVLRAQPTVICEVAGRNASGVRDILTGHGYVLYDGDQPADRRVPVGTARPNTLAIKNPHR
jgi:FkbM family methyltransferase